MIMRMVRIAVAGCTGCAGGELLRLLGSRDDVEIGIAGYDRPAEVTLATTLALPFNGARDEARHREQA